jgi:hypothetical protein
MAGIILGVPGETRLPLAYPTFEVLEFRQRARDQSYKHSHPSNTSTVHPQHTSPHPEMLVLARVQLQNPQSLFLIQQLPISPLRDTLIH